MDTCRCLENQDTDRLRVCEKTENAPAWKALVTAPRPVTESVVLADFFNGVTMGLRPTKV